MRRSTQEGDIMDQKIIVFAGKKQSGKSSAANFVAGYTMTQLGRAGYDFLPKHFNIDKKTGDLIVSTATKNVNGNTSLDYGVLDLNRKDPDFVNWASDCMWPYVKIYAYADMLKLVANLVFDIPYDLLNGSNEDKKTLTNVKWKDMCAFLAPRAVKRIKDKEKYNKKMNIREFLQYFGTNVCRKLYADCWTKSCFDNIITDQPDLAIVSDCRFRNEVIYAKKHNAKIVKLERSPCIDLHESEREIEKMHNNNFDLIIPEETEIKEKNQMILDKMYQWGWFDSHIGLEEEN